MIFIHRLHNIALRVSIDHHFSMGYSERSVLSPRSTHHQPIKLVLSLVVAFVDQQPHIVTPENALKFISNDAGVTYNLSLSVVWRNFEIADLDFWCSDAYLKFFEFLDQSGGFFYEVKFYNFSFKFDPCL